MNENIDSVVETEVRVEQPTFRWIPWALAAIAVVLYLLTLNHWVTLGSLPAIARMTGWDWHPANLDFRPTMLQPLYTLLTFPVTLLPMGWRPLAMNLISALLAVAVLWELARTVKLMPQDRTREQRQRSQNDFGVLVGPFCWIPACLAVALLGLQLTFWQNATQATGEILDLLIFAFCFRALMEHRVTGNDNWLLAMSLAYGLGVANNWVMIAFSPFFFVGVVWMKGMAFFDIKFLAKILAFGLVGLCLYLMVPVCDSLFGGREQSFWQTLRVYLRYQKTFLVDMPFVHIPQFRAQLFVILLSSLFPLVFCCIRWGRLGGDFNPAGSAATNVLLRLMHIFFLAVAAWVFFDPPFSPAQLGHKAMPFLTNYYMTALVAGYLTGYVVLIFGVEPASTWQRSMGLNRVLNKAMVSLAALMVLALPLLLFLKNWPAIRAANGDVLPQFANILAETLPDSHTIVLSEFEPQLMLLEAAYLRQGKTHHNLLLHTRSLHFPRYHRYLQEHYPEYRQWLFPTNAPPSRPLGDLEVLKLLTNLASTNLASINRVFYLHPSFGYFFEAFYLRPHGIVYELHRYPTDGSIMPPKLSTQEVDENENFWYGHEALTREATQQLRTEADDPVVVAQVLSRALDYWGTELQKAKLLRQAGERFTTALRLNPENAVAEINLKFNASLQHGSVAPVVTRVDTEKNLARFGNADSAIIAYGPFDELGFDYKLGELFARGQNRRQSMQLFQRCLDLSPNWVEPRIAMAKSYIDLQRPDMAVKVVEPLNALANQNALDLTNQVELLRVESFALAETGKYGAGEKLLLDAMESRRSDRNVLSALAYFYIMTGRETNALSRLEQLLLLDPNNSWALFNKGKILLQQRKYQGVIDTFEKLMTYQTSSFEPLLYLAAAYLQTGQLDKAKLDYEKAEKIGAEQYLFPVYFGLGEIAFRENNVLAQKTNYKRYLELVPRGGVYEKDYQTVKARYEKLTGGK